MSVLYKIFKVSSETNYLHNRNVSYPFRHFFVGSRACAANHCVIAEKCPYQ